MNESQFVVSGDGWVQVTPCGEYPHAGAGVTQVVDREACDRIAAEFIGRKADPNFPGVLVDFDHFSLDTDKSSEAAGWITELEARDTGLWARVRWSDSGLAAVQGGRFRLVSPVFPAPDACEDLGSGRIRPVKLVSVALTNEPNIKGGRPLANRQVIGNREEVIGGEESSGDAEARSGNDEPKGNVMSGPGAKKFMWLLGDPPKGPHCGECASRNGQVKTLLDWLRMPAPMCHCYCRLAEVGKDVPEGYKPEDGGRKSEDGDLTNRWSDAARAAARASRKANGWGGGGWSDAARAASLAVRREKAAARQAALTALGGTYSDGTPVIRDWAAGFDDYEPGQTTISDAAPFEERQRQYEQAFREWWDGVETTAGNIDRFNEFVAAFGGMAAAAAGASSPAGAASRAFGVGGSRAGQPKARRGALSRAWGGMRDALKRLGEEPVNDEAVVAVERAKAEFRARRTAEGSALAEAIRRIDPNAPAGLENFAVSQLRDYLRRLGGDPGKVAPRDSGPETFDALRAKYGVPVSKLKAPAKNAPKPSPAEIRESLAEYLMETLGHRPGNVDQNLGELKAQTAAAVRGVARAKETALRTQREASLARSMFGEGSPEHAKAVKAAEGAMWDYEHATRVSDRISGEYLSLKRNLDQFLERVREGGPIDWGPAEADYNALLESARRADPLGNRRGCGKDVDIWRAVGMKNDLVNGAARGRSVRRLSAAPLDNRWSDAARSAARASRKANGNYTGWTDAARAASLAVRQAKAAARASASGSSSDGYPGDYFTYDDGTPVIRDLVSEISDAARTYEAGQTAISDGTAFEERQRRYEEAFRQWWSGVETTAENIGKFHEFVAAFGGAAAAAAGAARPAGEATGLFGATGGRYGGQKPVYDQSGNVVGWAKVGGRPAAARRGSKPAREVVTSDPLNNPKTPADLAVRESYDRHLENVRSGYEAEMAEKGLDPQGYPLAPNRRPVPVEPYRPVWEKFYPDLEAAEQGGRDAFNEGCALGEAPYGLKEGTADWEAFWRGYQAESAAFEWEKNPVPLRVGAFSVGDGVRESGEPYGAGAPRTGLEMRGARDAARALGVLHGAYGVGEDGVEIPEALRGEYELGRAEGTKGYDYGIVPPKDRAAVLRGAQAYLAGALGEDDGYAPDHLNDRYNLADWDSAASWATRNQGKNGVYDPRTPDTRGQYSPASLMRTAMEWFRDAMVRGDRGESDAALSYMGDLLVSVSSDRRSAVDAVRGGSDEGGEDGEEAEIDAAMPEYDADGVEIGGEPFFEDSYADPNALPPWWRLLGNRWSDAARAAARASRKANGWGGGGWSDAARAAALAVRRAKSAARKAAEAAQAAGPAEQRPLAHPGFGAADDALEDYLKRKRRHEANEARKAADKSRLREEREARRERRNSSLKAKFDAPGLKEKFDQPGLREKFEAANERIDRDRLKDRPVKGNVWRPAEGFNVPVKGAVFYYNGNFYDDEGNWVAKAKPSRKSGAVWQNGLWYDAATGKTLGRTVAAS